MYEELSEINSKCQTCFRCALGKTRHNIVFSDGVPNPKLMLIGEAPGFYEDKEGKPFVGKAGQLLDKIFESVGLTRKKDVYICNTIKCRPPENRNPLPEEKLACQEYLDAQLRILNPKIILICGSVALNSLLPDKGGKNYEQETYYHSAARPRLNSGAGVGHSGHSCSYLLAQ